MSTYIIVLCITIANIIRQNILIINSLLMLAMPVHTAVLVVFSTTNMSKKAPLIKNVV